MVCQLELRKKEMVDLVKVWQGQIGLVPAAWEMPVHWIEGDIDLPVVPGEVEQIVDFEEWESDREDQGDGELMDLIEEFGLLGGDVAQGSEDWMDCELDGPVGSEDEAIVGGEEDMYMQSSSPVRNYM